MEVVDLQLFMCTKTCNTQLSISAGTYISKRRAVGDGALVDDDELWHTKPLQMDSQMMMAITIMMARTISFTFMFCNHILRRSFLPVRWKVSAC